jgi:hypothetical protein
MEKYIAQTKASFYDNIDTNLFREDISKDRVIDLLTYAMEGYQKQLIETFKTTDIKTEDLTQYYEDYEEFLQILRHIYYK